jgi:hypothetical protein
MEEGDDPVVKHKSTCWHFADQQPGVQAVVFTETESNPFVFRLRRVLHGADVFIAANVLRMPLIKV